MVSKLSLVMLAFLCLVDLVVTFIVVGCCGIHVVVLGPHVCCGMCVVIASVLYELIVELCPLGSYCKPLSSNLVAVGSPYDRCLHRRCSD